MVASAAQDWWRDAVIYQIYPRSFADGNGDGTGDLAGVRSRLPYLRDLGVDAVWFTPWYLSPLADGGYDVADYRRIDPAFGTLEEAEALIREAAELGIRTIIDIVPNHISDVHPWFQAALTAGPGSPERARFWFHPGAGEDGSQIPTHWVSSFQGATWTRTTNPDGTPGEWYLHLFTPEQPDVNWTHPEVRAEHEAVLRFWFDRGVAGIRIDSAAVIIKDPSFPEAPADEASIPPGQHPFIDRDEIHDVYRSWRRIADSYHPPRVLVGEIWLPDVQRFAAYLRPDEMHTAFNFDFMSRPWQAAELRASIEATLAAHREVGAPATWVLSNHDVTRPVTRYGRQETSFAFAAKRFGTPTDLERGRVRARAACLLTAALPGCLYLYQGDELGLPEDEELPLDVIQDPMHYRSGGTDPGRDGCRVPLPWTADPAANHGFSTPVPGLPAAAGRVLAPTRPWLPQPTWWGEYAVDAEDADPESMLWLYRRALRLRRQTADLRTGRFAWWELGPDVLAFTRGRFGCVVNLGSAPVRLPVDAGILLASRPLSDHRLDTDSAAWLRLPDPDPQPVDHREPTR
ncbi:MAG: glycoside hydrolase family 13 protein [Propionicimonas sp.]|uniref:glycoside hydrolase family 13 protein n=1 Tax=Propionicimonas sp. TaxID=1955623 RepID=UPI002B20A0EF|nr:glycoside hydrolase family 13 protein [Propionicimonas sp.]MEA4943219.1 glycoside hydrolase family 13 protein [Propionicimonas sp.]